MSKFAGTAATALLIALSFGGWSAASEICDRLGFELSTLAETPSPTEEARKFSRAIADQKRNLLQIDRALRQAGCSSDSIVVVESGNKGECTSLEAKRTRMQRNLQILDSKRVALLSQVSSGLKRQKLVSALAENRCNEEPILIGAPEETTPLPVVTDDPQGVETIRVPSSEPDYNGSRFVDLGGASDNGAYRTVCVRACDGAYFPISSQASTLSFRRDAQVCSMMCPGTETELYYHSIHQESADMRSAETGRSYSDLPNAFRFRTEKPRPKELCGCNFSLYYKEMLRREAFVKNPASVPEKQAAIVWAKPELRGGLKKEDEPAKAMPVKERPYVPGNGMRIIGPQFFPNDGLDFTKPLPEQ